MNNTATLPETANLIENLVVWEQSAEPIMREALATLGHGRVLLLGIAAREGRAVTRRESDLFADLLVRANAALVATSTTFGVPMPIHPYADPGPLGELVFCLHLVTALARRFIQRQGCRIGATDRRRACAVCRRGERIRRTLTPR